MYLEHAELERLNDAQARALLLKKPVLLLPIGAVEAHGDHLPAGTDNYLARRLAATLVERIAGATPVMLLPLLPFGQVWSLSDAPGSFSISNETVSRTVSEIGLSMLEKGLSSLAVINAHYGNVTALREAQRQLKDKGVTVAIFNYPGAAEPTKTVRERPAAHPSYMHACEIETSYMLHLAPELVRMDEAIVNYPDFPADFGEVAYRWSEFSASPVLGDATAATGEKGRIILDAVINRMAELVADLYSRQSGSRSIGETSP
ncbi:creatininase family protein [Mesorhizobium helmanticense]|uniref:creatininase family protein n=1 Tax=Mesorhizobium helmanticense TaxID=1776423 RepID=UPI001ABF35C6|nr:creatininase family protein [Mesorhizobium helmanticense]